jgi:UDP-N-acetylglucosamine 4,6-dehydratase
VRFGNLLWSRDSVAERFAAQLLAGRLPFRVTDARMSRFGIPLPEAVAFILSSLEILRGGEVFVPRLKSFRIVDLAESIYLRHRRTHEQTPIEVTGLRPGGEKLAEMILTPEESTHAVWVEEHQRWVIEPVLRTWNRPAWEGEPVPEGYELTSDKNAAWFTQAELRETLQWIPR